MIDIHCSYTELKDPTLLVPNPRNPNQHSATQINLLARIIQSQGWRAPITISKRSGFVVRGHGRLEAALALGLTEVPVDVQEYASEAEEYADLIADNRLAELSSIDNKLLADLLKDTGDCAAFTGFSAKEIDKLVSEAECLADSGTEDAFNVDIDGASEPITREGDIWVLGEHRLLCGDSTKLESAERLMGEEKADMCFTDPPYNVAYEGKTKDKLTIKNDSMSEDSFRTFLFNAFSTIYAVLKNGGVFYICHADSYGFNFRQAIHLSGLTLKQCIVWVKNVLVMGRQDYQWKHEPILYGWKEGAPHYFCGGRKQTTVIDKHIPLEVSKAEDGYLLNFKTDLHDINVKVPSFEVVDQGSEVFDTVWRFDKPLANKVHPTMKPIELCARGILNSSRKGEIVYEPFAGSGSTLIACEQTERKCRAIELDPVYCDVIVERYISYVGDSVNVYVERDGERIAYNDL